jgi:hypothetical protein
VIDIEAQFDWREDFTYSSGNKQNLTHSLPSSAQATFTSTGAHPKSSESSRSLPSSPQDTHKKTGKSTPLPSRSSAIRALNFGETTPHALVSTPPTIHTKGTGSPEQIERTGISEKLDFGHEELIAGTQMYYLLCNLLMHIYVADSEEFRQIVIDAIVAKKIYKIEKLKSFFDYVIEVNSHQDIAELTEIVNNICKSLAEWKWCMSYSVKILNNILSHPLSSKSTVTMVGAAAGTSYAPPGQGSSKEEQNQTKDDISLENIIAGKINLPNLSLQMIEYCAETAELYNKHLSEYLENAR